MSTGEDLDMHPDVLREWHVGGGGGPIVEVVRTEQGPAIGLWAPEGVDRRIWPEEARAVAQALLEAAAMVEATS